MWRTDRLARAEARNRTRYARAQTRRWRPIPGGEQYVQPVTDLLKVMRITRGMEGGEVTFEGLALVVRDRVTQIEQDEGLTRVQAMLRVEEEVSAITRQILDNDM